MSKSQNIKSEAKIQQEIVMWYRNTYCLISHNPRCMIFSIPNESNGPRAMQLIQTGLYPGAADLGVLHKGDDHWRDISFFEVKTTIGIQSPKQKEFQKHCKEMGIGYYIVRSLDEFKEVIESL